MNLKKDSVENFQKVNEILKHSNLPRIGAAADTGDELLDVVGTARDYLKKIHHFPRKKNRQLFRTWTREKSAPRMTTSEPTAQAWKKGKISEKYSEFMESSVNSNRNNFESRDTTSKEKYSVKKTVWTLRKKMIVQKTHNESGSLDAADRVHIFAFVQGARDHLNWFVYRLIARRTLIIHLWSKYFRNRLVKIVFLREKNWCIFWKFETGTGRSPNLNGVNSWQAC